MRVGVGSERPFPNNATSGERGLILKNPSGLRGVLLYWLYGPSGLPYQEFDGGIPALGSGSVRTTSTTSSAMTSILSRASSVSSSYTMPSLLSSSRSSASICSFCQCRYASPFRAYSSQNALMFSKPSILLILLRVYSAGCSGFPCATN